MSKKVTKEKTVTVKGDEAEELVRTFDNLMVSKMLNDSFLPL
jgi:hypothetical protein